jgi:hypothetical protein
MGYIPNETIDGSVLHTTTKTIQCFEPTTKKTVVIGFDQFFMPEFISIKNVLKSITSQKREGGEYNESFLYAPWLK